MIDLDRPIREQLRLLRISDPLRYPAHFEYLGFVYDIVLTKRGQLQHGRRK